MPARPPVDAPMEVFAECSEWLVIIGGSAVQAYGMNRMTFDCDCAILDRDEMKLRVALGRLGYIVDEHRPTFTRYRHLGKRRPIVDAMRNDAPTFAKVLTESRWMKILGCRVRVAAPLHLVAMKLHALKQQPDRAFKDWPDICHLLETLPDDWTPDALKAIAERYASEEFSALLKQRHFL